MSTTAEKRAILWHNIWNKFGWEYRNDIHRILYKVLLKMLVIYSVRGGGVKVKAYD